MLDAVAWADAEDLVRELIGQILAPYGVGAEVTYVRGVPPVVNEPRSTALLGAAVERGARRGGPVSTAAEPRRRGLRVVPRGRPGRDGPPRAPARRAGATYDLHQGDLRVDERAIAVGAKVLAGAVLSTLDA